MGVTFWSPLGHFWAISGITLGSLLGHPRRLFLYTSGTFVALGFGPARKFELEALDPTVRDDFSLDSENGHEKRFEKNRPAPRGGGQNNCQHFVENWPFGRHFRPQGVLLVLKVPPGV